MALKINRRSVLAGGAAAAAGLTFPMPALALNYPNRPVRLVLGFPPGGSADIVSRLVAQGLSERMKQAFIVDNRAGAGSNLAAAGVARSTIRAPAGKSARRAAITERSLRLVRLRRRARSSASAKGLVR